MRVISKPRLRAFWRRYPEAEAPLKTWWKIATRARWATIADVRATFPQADAVTLKCGKTVTVFNVGGNKFRLIVAIVYHAHTVYIKHVLTHSEYDAESWKAQICRE